MKQLGEQCKKRREKETFLIVIPHDVPWVELLCFARNERRFDKTRQVAAVRENSALNFYLTRNAVVQRIYGIIVN